MKKIIGPEETKEMPRVQPKTQAAAGKTQARKKLDPKKDWSFKVIVVTLILVLIPTLFFGITLFRAYRGTGRPIIGQRFKADLDPALDEKSFKEFALALEDLPGVEKAAVNLKTATLRINLQTESGLEKEAYEALGQEVEKTLYEHYDRQAYFTSQKGQLQYDFEIYAYNLEDSIIHTRYKSSRSPESKAQFLTDAASEEMAQELKDRQEAKDNPDETESLPEVESEENDE